MMARMMVSETLKSWKRSRKMDDRDLIAVRGIE